MGPSGAGEPKQKGREMSEINFQCPHCQQELTAPDELAGQSLECPACGKEFTVPGGIVEQEDLRPAYPGESEDDADKGKTVRIELPPELLAPPEKHVFKIKRIQH